MDSDRGKIFIGGISWETTEELVKEYFRAFGDVVEVVIMKDKITGRARGFGFVVFADPSVADRVVLEKHMIDGRMVEAKKAVPRDEQHSMTRSNNGGHVPASQTRTKKIFVGGLAPSVTENDFRNYFQQFGTITDVVVMHDHGTQRPRGFGFITYDSEDAVDVVVQKPFHELNGKLVEVKRSIPKQQSTGNAKYPSGGFGGVAGRGGGFGYGFNSSMSGPYGPRMNTKHADAPGGRGGYTSYGPTGSGYNALGYGDGGGYGPTMNGVSYGSSTFRTNPSYSTITGGTYGGALTGYGSPATGAYNNNQAPGRNVWGNGGYGSVGNGSISGYGGGAAWGLGQASNNQQNGSVAGYASGYGSSENNYGSSAGAYPAQNSGYGTEVATYSQTTGAYGGAYTDSYSKSAYGDSAWRSNPSEPVGAHSVGYGLSITVRDQLHK